MNTKLYEKIFDNKDLLNFQVPAGPREVSEVTAQLKETLVTPSSSSSSSSTSSSTTASTRKGYQLEQDIGTMLYSGESQYTISCPGCHTSHLTNTNTSPEIRFHWQEVQLKYSFYQRPGQHFVLWISLLSLNTNKVNKENTIRNNLM